MHPRAIGAVALLVAVIAAVAALLVTRPQPDGPEPDPDPEIAQQTLLVQVRDSSLLATGSVMMGVSEQSLHSMYWTGDWWIDQIGPDEVTASEMGRLPLPDVMQTVGDQVGVQIDNAWVIDRLAFAGLVDGVGGVRLDLPKRLVYEDVNGIPVLIPAGLRDFQGAEAADFIMDPTLVDEAERQRRFEAVWTQALRRFPSEPERARTLIVSLGALSKATMSTEELADLLSSARELLVTAKQVKFVLPLAEDNSVRITPRESLVRAYAIDAAAAEGPMGLLFPGYARPAEPVARVSATAFRGDDVVAVEEQLLTRGWNSVWGGRADADLTQVLVRPDTDADDREGLLAAVGVQPVDAPVPLTDAEVVVVE